jgi:hypothetical protein
MYGVQLQFEAVNNQLSQERFTTGDCMIKFKFTVCHPDGSKDYYLAACKSMEGSMGYANYRENGPAEIRADGTEVYYTNGKIHRTDGPAVVSPNGYQEYYSKGKISRTDGPAILFPDGGKEWLENGLWHRLDGPARISANGAKEYYFRGKRIMAESEQEYARMMKYRNLMDL